MNWNRSFGAAIVITIIAVAAPSRGGQNPAAKCAAAHNRAAGKYAACLHAVEANVSLADGRCSLTSSARCHRDDECPGGETCGKDTGKFLAVAAKCTARFADKWDAAERKTAEDGASCPVNVDRLAIQGAIDGSVANVRTAVSGGSLRDFPTEIADLESDLDRLRHPTCGDDQIGAGESCDGDELNGETCVSLGFAGGALACLGCAYDTSACTVTCPAVDECHAAGTGRLSNGAVECTPGSPHSGNPCDDGDPTTGNRCRDGACAEIASRYCTETGCFYCVTSPDGYEECFPDGYGCAADSACAAGEYCDEATGACVQSGSCDSDAQCGYGMACNCSGSCVPAGTEGGPCSPSCLSVGCPSGYVCTAEGTCVPNPPPPCASSTDQVSCEQRTDCQAIIGGSDCHRPDGSTCQSGDADCICGPPFVFQACVAG